MSEYSVDVRDLRAVREALAKARPEVVLHMAAQPILRRSLVEPVATYEVNVLGTVSLLEGVRQAPGEVRAVVVVTSDKCYAHQPEHPRRRFDGSGGELQGDVPRPIGPGARQVQGPDLQDLSATRQVGGGRG